MFHPPLAPSIANGFLNQSHVSELLPGGPRRFLCGFAAFCALLHCHLQMAPHFLVEFLLPFAKESNQPVHRDSPSPPTSNFRFPFSNSYSYLSATIGSTFIARLAGTDAARTAQAARTAAATPMIIGS